MKIYSHLTNYSDSYVYKCETNALKLCPAAGTYYLSKIVIKKTSKGFISGQVDVLTAHISAKCSSQRHSDTVMVLSSEWLLLEAQKRPHHQELIME